MSIRGMGERAAAALSSSERYFEETESTDNLDFFYRQQRD